MILKFEVNQIKCGSYCGSYLSRQLEKSCFKKNAFKVLHITYKTYKNYIFYI